MSQQIKSSTPSLQYTYHTDYHLHITWFRNRGSGIRNRTKMVQESFLLNGQQKAVQLAPHKENRTKFLRAIEIYTTKPQVVDRRVLCSLGVASRTLKPRTVSSYALFEKYLKDFIGEEMQDVEESPDRRDVGTERTEEAAMESNEKPGNNMKIRLCKILPRLSERMESFHQLVLFDETACEVFFIRLNKAKPYFPEDINQSWSYSVSCNVQSQQILITTSELYEEPHPDSSLPVLNPPSKEWLFYTLAPKLVKWTNQIDPELPLHVKKSVISMERYSEMHAYIKTKYAANIIKIWPECTDPQKFVYEDIAVAAYLIVLWEEERQRKKKEKDLLEKQSFVDLGCGNGLLVHILNSEGHPGKGIDLRKRKIWDLYGSGTNLEEAVIIPTETKHLEKYDWLIGNHSKELTPWIPVMAFRSSLNTRYFVLPCCFHDFDRKYIKEDSSTSQYRSYLNFIQEVGKICGYQVEEDSLRIPSTKKICQIGMELPTPELRTLKNSQIDWYIETRSTSKEGQKSCNATGSLEDYLADLDKPMSEKAVSSKLSANFEPRQREETVRNCSNLSNDLKEEIVRKVFDAILAAGENPEVEGQKANKPKSWRKGGVITIKEVVELLEQDTLKQLKSECGGLKTLLKNHYQIFQVEGNRVHMRDWSEKDSRSPKVSSKNKQKDSERRKEKFKTKLCWFQKNHPDGCPLEELECPFAHSSDNLKTLPENEPIFPNCEILFGKKLEKFDHAPKQLLVA